MEKVERINDLNQISFPNLGFDFFIDPVAFTVFGVEIKWYGILITLGVLIAILYCYPKMKKFGLDSDRATDAVLGGIFGSIIGARAYYVIFQWEDYKDDIISIFNIRNGGLAIYGGLIGAVLVGGIVCKLRKVKFLPMFDIAVIGFLIGQGIGRWGNFINQEAFGTNTDSLFAMTGGQIQRTIINETAYMDGDMYMNGLNMSEEYAVHPCFLYESFWCLLGFILLSLFIKRRKYDGQLALMYVGWYGIGRFFIEGLRTDSLMVGELKASQVFAGLCAITAIVILVLMEIKYKKSGGEGFVLYVNTEESKQLLAEAEKARNGEDDDDDKDYTSIVSDENANDENNENNTESEITEEKENGTVN